MCDLKDLPIQLGSQTWHKPIKVILNLTAMNVPTYQSLIMRRRLLSLVGQLFETGLSLDLLRLGWVDNRTRLSHNTFCTNLDRMKLSDHGLVIISIERVNKSVRLVLRQAR
jgi:hypothetical protein